ncbi:hypothetical protein QYE76_067396 [Lolium multiflorum]|uniref:Retrotransposon gag domain-containing protein n=1 Tax=Lolium multiflorum TaxID=4521 RepID=A0AAD8WAP5_LOLMU|nr:hypothetical protein QYE76_067396 [Lolium multiflorum]
MTISGEEEATSSVEPKVAASGALVSRKNPEIASTHRREAGVDDMAQTEGLPAAHHQPRPECCGEPMGGGSPQRRPSQPRRPVRQGTADGRRTAAVAHPNRAPAPPCVEEVGSGRRSPCSDEEGFYGFDHVFEPARRHRRHHRRATHGLHRRAVAGLRRRQGRRCRRRCAPVLSPVELSAVVRDLSPAVSNLRTYLQGPVAPPPPPPAAAFTAPQPPPPTSVYQQGVPITQIRFPPSPSPTPSWADAPIFTTAAPQPTVLQVPASTTALGGFAGYIDPFAGGPFTTTPPAPQPPRFTKMEFATYDGTVDPLNWLNHCDQFFRGQRTLVSDRTWIASYHLRGAAQTWYYALEQDEGGMPPWERFRDLCLLRFGPPIRGSRLAELSRLPFTTSVQDFADRFQTLACHAPGVTARQRAELFVGGLPDHICVDVEMRDTPDLQTAMYYARAYEHRALALQQTLHGRGVRPPPRAAPAPAASAPPRPALPAAPSGAPPTPTRPFRRLTSAEQLERRRKGLCFNCNETYAPGHVCARLFYLETVDDGDVETLTTELAASTLSESGVTTYGPVDATAFVVSLHALAGIKTPKTMLLPVTINGERLTALVDTGSTHNFLSGAAMRRLALPPSSTDTLSVTVANGDRLACQGVAR